MAMPNNEDLGGKKEKPPKTAHQKLADQDKKFQKRYKEMQQQKMDLMKHKLMKEEEKRAKAKMIVQ